MSRSARANTSLTQDAYERLRSDLLACRLRPGARLHIGELCQALSVNLSAVREALSRLTSEGLVVAEPQRGCRVAPISVEELRDLTRVRAEIEGMCLECATAAGDVGWEAQLVPAFHRLSRTPEREPGDPQRMNEAWSAAHAAFHEALVAGCDSPWLLRLRGILYVQSERYRRLSVPLAEAVRDLNSEHRGIMEAALAHDPEQARTFMTRHIEMTTRVLLEQSWPTGPATASGRRGAAEGVEAVGTAAQPGTQRPCRSDQVCGRGYPSPARGSGDADGDWASELQHTVECMDGDVHLGRPTLVGARAHPPPASHVLRTRNLGRLRPSTITCLNLPMAASARARFV